ncbi:sporulation initiation inhibitor protein Soj [Clostridia bacterium]|nr:sporulation initiation inhibitor protein Soj [Clostridia bacterium]
MGKIVAFANQKGGVGKTTSCINVAAYVAIMGKKTVVVDIDPQGNLTSGLGIRKNKLTRSIYSMLIDDINAVEVILHTGVPGLDIIPSNVDLAGAEVQLVPFTEREYVLKKAIQRLKNTYDYVFIDCPPSLGLLTINALTASDSVLIPIQGEFFALEGLSQLMNTIKLVKKHTNKTLDIEGVILTMFDPRSNIVVSVAEEVTKLFGKKVFSIKIPRNIKLVEAPSYGLPILQYEPRSNGALAYKALSEEFLQRNNEVFNKIVSDRALKKRIVPAKNETTDKV